MKNLNPLVGLRQIASGYIFLRRYATLNLVKKNLLKPSELGYYFIFVLSADWDKGKFRNGYIRHDLKRLAKMWKIPYSTLTGYLKNFVSKGLILMIDGTPMIVDFNTFSKGFNLPKILDEDLVNLFPELINKNDISELVVANHRKPFKDSFKGSISIIRDESDYKADVDSNDLSDEDKKLIDEILKVNNY